MLVWVGGKVREKYGEREGGRKGGSEGGGEKETGQNSQWDAELHVPGDLHTLVPVYQ